MEPTIVTLDELAGHIQQAKAAGKSVAHCHGCFDLLHPGHVKYFEEAASKGDLLVVTVTPDRFVDKGPTRPVFTEDIRLEMIGALRCVDYVALNAWPTAVNTLRLLKPDIYVKGEEFDKKEDKTGKLQLEVDVLTEIGATIQFTHSDIIYSSTKLLNDEFGLLPDDLVAFLIGFRKRHHGQILLDLLDQLQDLKILVIGDAIIDDYHYVKPQGKSPKANVVTTQYQYNESGIGGSLCIANHLGSFCNDVRLMAVLGDEKSWEGYIREKLPDHVTFLPSFRPNAPTTAKRRYLEPVFFEKIFEVHFYDDTPIPESCEHALIADLEKQLDEVDIVLVADFGHGMMTKPIIDLLCKKAPYLAITVQTNSTNYGYNYITKYPKADFICIDERELRLASHDRFGHIHDLAPSLLATLQAPTGIITLGKNGSAMFSQEEEIAKTPVLTGKTTDPVGAGDAFFSLAAPLTLLQAEPEMITFAGNAAGALAANIIGNNQSIRRSEYLKFAGGLLK